MAAVADLYFANVGVITVTGVGGTPTSTTLAVVKDLEATWEAEHVEAYGWGSILRQGVAKHSAKVTLKIGFLKFLPGTGAWWPLYITDPTSAAGTVTDTNSVKLFDVVATFTPLTSGNTTWKRTISNVYFPKFPMKATEGQWIKVDMEGTGSTITDANL